MTVDNTLQTRKNSHGEFIDHARITQEIKAAMQASPNWAKLHPCVKEALDMNAHKVGRILCGDPYYGDHWHDIQGYAKLVEDRLPRIGGPKIPPLPAGGEYTARVASGEPLSRIRIDEEGNVEESIAPVPRGDDP